ncbi:MAG: dTDP-4-dehydrorhamnose 3,5-epimerase family protein [Spirochaetia bacterium]|nr:dTDP-4-dehydrorhamnose 3,5-epimerase family protein [Spirochaetia bacterium]
MIAGVKVKQLKAISDERGRLMEMLRADDDIFIKFGQAYMTTCYPGVVKGWHYHKKQLDNFICVKGMIKLVLFDSREKSKTKGEVNEFFLGEHNTILVQIPKNVYHGFKGISETEAVIINCSTMPYNPKDPDEYRLPAHTKEIPYEWARKDR